MPDLRKISALLTLGFLIECVLSAQSNGDHSPVKTSSVVRSDRGEDRRLSPSSRNSVRRPEEDISVDDDDGQWYWLEVKAIIGGVLGFWGGVGSLGTLFLVIVLSQRYCCKKSDDKDEANG